MNSSSFSTNWHRYALDSWDKQPDVTKGKEELEDLVKASAAGQDPTVPLKTLATVNHSAIIVGLEGNPRAGIKVYHNFFASPKVALHL